MARLTCPRANIPATTALATLNRHEGRELGLVRGANVVMPNLTPPEYRALYEIYPHKACLAETGEECHDCLTARIASLGRRPGRGRGDSLNYTRRNQQSPLPLGAGQGVRAGGLPLGMSDALPTALTLALSQRERGANPMDQTKLSRSGSTSSTRSACRACWTAGPTPAR